LNLTALKISENLISRRNEKLLKKILSVALLGFLSFGTANAQVVTVTGMGLDRESAIRDASRNAVEQVVGTFIDSKVLMSDLIIQFDEVYKKSQGFVKDIKILSEGKSDDSAYKVQARIDVDTNPDADLMNNITMLLNLNDPRIAVVILQQGSSEHEIEAETAINSKLLEMGFSHVVDAEHLIKLQDANLLRAIYNGQKTLQGDTDNAIDHLIIGESKVRATRETIPNFYNGKSLDTPLVSGSAAISIKVLKYDTGDLLSNFTAKGIGRGNSGDNAVEQAVDNAAVNAAQEIEKTFKKFAAKTTQGIQVNLSVEDYETAEALAKDLRTISGVDAVYIRSHNGNKAVLEIESTQKPHIIVQMLRQRTELNIFVEKITDSTIDMAVS